MSIQIDGEQTPFAIRSGVWWIPSTYRGSWATVSVEEFTENGTLVIRAELPGMDPAKDVEITISHGRLHIAAERREEEGVRHFHRRELHYGTFERSLELPEGIDQATISASYKDGILEVRVPLPETKTAEPTTRVPVGRR